MACPADAVLTHNAAISAADSILLYLPEPIGWIALSPEALRDAQTAAREALRGKDTPVRDCPTRTDSPHLMTAAEAADLLSVDPLWLQKQAREGRIPYVKLGRFVRFDPKAIVEHCARLAGAPTPLTTVQRTKSAQRKQTRGSAIRSPSITP